MYTIDRRVEVQTEAAFRLLGAEERLLFFDIETTGLSAARAGLYLIGALQKLADGWHLQQWFAEDAFDEKAVVEAFFAAVEEKQKRLSGERLILLSYNGEGFDAPFLKKCAAQYHRQSPLDACEHVDLYRRIRPYQKLLGLSDCKLKTVERMLGIFREDRFSGGELIEVYGVYRELSAGARAGNAAANKQCEELRKVLLLHNAEDIADMPTVCRALGVWALFSGAFVPEHAELCEADTGMEKGVSGKPQRVLHLSFRLQVPLPKPLAYEGAYFKIWAGEPADQTALRMEIRLYEGELKYFFADYASYYYLPIEDYAIHKSVGQFVDAKSRRQATAKTCYQRKSGLYLPQPEAVFAPVFYEAYQGKQLYAAYTEALCADEEGLLRYARALLQACVGKKR